MEPLYSIRGRYETDAAPLCHRFPTELLHEAKEFIAGKGFRTLLAEETQSFSAQIFDQNLTVSTIHAYWTSNISKRVLAEYAPLHLQKPELISDSYKHLRGTKAIYPELIEFFSDSSARTASCDCRIRYFRFSGESHV
ncbi:MAG: hypothetical protein TR69_WS6001000265 [candidate division WS6 bacterium OLB20]|uniref:Uncharacterized protein n=1 Tax=candidate division WS6 bacterium OLB20 TaxID=1617426 RepID=A0A136M0F8_9BACT|nr:MAG: hypothetical protein TR69_WS6001000265 [candidate division WS6 bacterium OLB20]